MNDVECAICLNTIDGEEYTKLDNCRHRFCTNCIVRWCMESNTCPMDRQEIDKVEIIYKDQKLKGSMAAHLHGSMVAMTQDFIDQHICATAAIIECTMTTIDDFSATKIKIGDKDFQDKLSINKENITSCQNKCDKYNLQLNVAMNIWNVNINEDIEDEKEKIEMIDDLCEYVQDMLDMLVGHEESDSDVMVANIKEKLDILRANIVESEVKDERLHRLFFNRRRCHDVCLVCQQIKDRDVLVQFRENTEDGVSNGSCEHSVCKDCLRKWKLRVISCPLHEHGVFEMIISEADLQESSISAESFVKLTPLKSTANAGDISTTSVSSILHDESTTQISTIADIPCKTSTSNIKEAERNSSLIQHRYSSNSVHAEHSIYNTRSRGVTVTAWARIRNIGDNPNKPCRLSRIF